MNIDRQLLQGKLQAILPALSDQDLVPIFSHFLFTGKRVLAYNDRIALSVPLETQFKGTLPSKTTYEMVAGATYAKTANITALNGQAKLVCGKGEWLLGTRPESDFTGQFQMPAAPKAAEGVLDNENFFAAIDNCLQSVGKTATVNEEFGVTLIPEGRNVSMYASDRKTMTYAKLPLPQIGLSEQVIMPAEFCKQMLALRDAERKRLVVRRDHAMFAADDVLFFGRLLAPDGTVTFSATLKRALPANFPQSMAKFDNSGKQRGRLKSIFDLATTFTNADSKNARIKIAVKDNTLRASAVNIMGEEYKDQTVLTHHPDVSIAVNPGLISSVYDRYESILFTDKCALLATGANNIYLTAKLN